MSSGLPTSGDLKAVLTADIRGFSEQMTEDEERVLKLLVDFYYATVSAACERHGGRLFRKEGDAVWCVFESVVEAVRAGIEIQAEFLVKAETDPHAKSLGLRMGIHLGDVSILPDGDVLGNALSFAKRLETNCPEGAILITQEVHALIASRKLAFDFMDCGSIDLKGLGAHRVFEGRPSTELLGELERSRGVRLVRGGARVARPLPPPAQIETAERRRAEAARRKRGPAIFAIVVLVVGAGFVAMRFVDPSTPPQERRRPATGPLHIAILPFENQGEDAEIKFLVGGLTDVVTADIVRAPDVKLVERAQVKVDLGELDFNQTKYVDPATRQEIGKITGAEVVVIGGFQRYEGRVRVVARFVRVETGEIVDSVIVERGEKEIFALQDDLAARVRELLPELTKRVRE